MTPPAIAGATEFGRQVEAGGFPGIWIGDSLGRGRPTLDSLQVLTALAALTRRVELGISVLQLPLRNPVELAHRTRRSQAWRPTRSTSSRANTGLSRRICAMPRAASRRVRSRPTGHGTLIPTT